VAVASNSVFCALYVHTPAFELRSALPVIGQVIIGCRLSITVIVKLQLTAVVTPSVADHVTVVTPLLNILFAKVVPVPVVAPLNE